MVQLRRGFSVALLVCAMVSTSFGIAGIGIHWGNDFSLYMEDAEKEWVAFEDLTIDNLAGIGGTLPDELASEISGRDLPIYISRTDWRNTRINGGLKVFIDVIPVLDALEFSTNFGLWEYDGSITYPTGLQVREGLDYSASMPPDSIFEPVYETGPLTLESYGFGLMGLRKTPYMKLQFDLTVRKYIAQLPPVVKILKIYGGGGVSLNFTTPVLSRQLVEDALAEAGRSLGDANSLNSLALFSEEEIIQAVVEQIYTNLMIPHFGMHLDLGVMIKIPVIPLGVYVDGKLMIPFGEMDKYVDVGGFGLLLNTGISLTF
jgi:hypothetical protein